ncbi:MAG: helix-turn-helix domain-containing protein [Chloroflexi bacterium]|nr:helix-turn-helix domain-containing protein [Chloroflexota bacterium]
MISISGKKKPLAVRAARGFATQHAHLRQGVPLGSVAPCQPRRTGFKGHLAVYSVPTRIPPSDRGDNDDRIATPALPFCHATLKAAKPLSAAYPTELKSIGDHIRKRRLDLGLPQREVAERIGVAETTVWDWENNRSPEIHVMPRVIAFLGYLPGGNTTTSTTFSERLVRTRIELGLSRRNLALWLGVDEGTIQQWERGRTPTFRRHKRVHYQLEALRSQLSAAARATSIGTARPDADHK